MGIRRPYRILTNLVHLLSYIHQLVFTSMELSKEYFDEQLKNLATKQDLEALASKAEVVGLRADVAGLRSDVTTLRTDVNELRSGITELRSDVMALQDDMSSVRADLREVREIVSRIDKRDIEDSNAFAKDIVQLQKDVKELKLRHAS